MEQIKLNDINFHSLQKLKHQGTKATLYRDGNVCFKILDGLYDDEKGLREVWIQVDPHPL